MDVCGHRSVVCGVLGVLTVVCPSLAQEDISFGGEALQESSVACTSTAPDVGASGVQSDADRSFDRGAQSFALTFWPQAGRRNRDLFTNNHVDILPGLGLLDWDCSNFTYDGHEGIDVDLRTFEEQTIGVPIYAAADGVVVSTADGHFDRNTFCSGPTNFVRIDHGNGWFSRYLHLKSGSVAVSPGQFVRAGRQIGLTGSSGCSTGPHLHLDLQFASTFVEPSVGPCHGGTSLWNEQAPVFRDLLVWDAAVTHTPAAQIPTPPFEMPRGGVIGQAEQDPILLWTIVRNMPPQSTWQARLVRPDGIVFANSSGSFNNAVAYRYSWWFWWYAPSATTLTTPGQWRFVILINGQPAIDAPFQMAPQRIGVDLNEPPANVVASFSKPTVEFDEVLIAEADMPLLLDDPNYDVVRYEYVWEVNDFEVRRVTSAAMSDVLPRLSTQPGVEVRCTITASDGSLSSSPNSATITVGPCPGDADRSLDVNFADITSILSNWTRDYGDGTGPGDADANSVVNFADVTRVLNNWASDCPAFR